MMLKIYVYVVVFFLFSTLSYTLLYIEKEQKIEEYLNEKTKQYSENYDALYHQQHQLAQMIYEYKINTPEIIQIFKDASSSSLKERNRVREKLYNQLHESYILLKNKFMIKQIHFHTPENKSFLRFHRPNVHDDDLTDIRETIKYVNANKKAVDGFEEGRIYNGYRFVFPMFDEDKHIGSVEVSFSTFSFNEDFMMHYDVISNFYILRSVVNQKVFENERGNYRHSLIQDFCLEKEMVKQIENLKNIRLNKPFSSQTVEILNKRAKDKDSFSLYDNKRREVITFIKVINPISKHVVGLFVVRSSAYYIFNKMSNFYIMFFILNLFMIAVLYLIYKETKYRRKIHNINLSLEATVKEKTKEQSLLLSLFDKGDIVLFIWNNDISWSVKEVSLSVHTLSGYTKEEFLSRHIKFGDIVHKDDLQRVSEEVAKAIASKEEFFKHSPYRIVTKENHERWILDYTIIVRDEKGDVVNFIGAISDITELKKQEYMMIHQSKLAQMGEMISMIAHQWRHPLGAISAQLLDMRIKDELEHFNLNEKDEVQRYRKYVNTNVEKTALYVQNLSTTIDDFRNFYKPNKELDYIYLMESFEKAFAIIKSSLESDSIEIIQKQFGESKKVTIYNNEIMQVILNILKNAQDNFKEKKTLNPKISIICDYNSSKERVLLSICDNGGGISEEIIDKIFDPYFSTKDEKNGTGLGLYMSKTIVEQHHNGKLYAYNRSGGVCFVIELPRTHTPKVIER